MLEKREKIFQLISTLFLKCEESFSGPWKIVPLKKITFLGWRSADFLQGVLSPKIIAGPVPSYLF
jgi:hypothetical protein